ncbi:maleylpyruvate isomerase [Lipingzhangella halophila]|uniref:Maleylpyruvate isomerase n=1 Tax=Lipingzhangella halophila TaxID=1783352 RepID=A0A7W7W5W2_9ACTN|nr:maleylpyruvate isomerase family mycothiol-dependent enzyme [Lipingzhangella halophila]MBB4935191.1 maleylpyruvate isomerase [Lipingzhangella halophila]
MAEDPATRTRLAWLDRGTEVFNTALADLSDHDLDGPSLLPNWSRRHVVAHVGYNARALDRLVHWARTGVETPMYPDAETRSAEIEQGAALPAEELRALAVESAEQLRADLASLPDDRWQSRVVTAQGRTVPATEIPWMRCREVWIHTVDLGGAGFADLPADLLDAIAYDVLDLWERRSHGAGIALDALDRSPGWPGRDAPGAGRHPVTCHGTAAALTAWLTGRAPPPAGVDPGDAVPPDLPNWL